MNRIKIPHESAGLHVSGEAVYVDDILTDERLLSGYVVYSPHAHAKIKAIEISEARRYPGVYAVLTFADIPGENQMGPVVPDEPCLAESTVQFNGQAICLIAGESEQICRKAASLIRIKYEILPAVLSIEAAIEHDCKMGNQSTIKRGDAESSLASARHVFSGELHTGAQEHWYLETQACLCVPGENEEVMVYSSTQHPSETQALVAKVLGVSRNNITVEVRRMGGGFGGKETQANHTACWTALLSRATGRPVKIRLFRDDDQKMTGKRHPFLIRYQVGCDNNGRLTAAKFEMNSDGGAAVDLSFAIMERAMFHIDNAYFIPNLTVTGQVWRTNLPPNTALRGFGGPQGMAAIENVIDRIARFLKMDSLDIRRKNFYGNNTRNITHYGQKVAHNHLHRIYRQLTASAQYRKRRLEINRFNSANEFYKKGMACTPVKFGISFTTSFLNQAGALVNIYQDGTVLVNHGGTEMGQGLFTKMRQVAAAELGISYSRVRVNATDTSKVPNTSATAASSGTDLNGMAVKNAVVKLKHRLVQAVLPEFNDVDAASPAKEKDIVFIDGFLQDSRSSGKRIPFETAVKTAYLKQTSLSATGYYSTPNIHWDKKLGRGHPFNYYAFGMAVSEILLDTLTGHHRIIRTDILHDTGDSLNPDIDLGQIQGGFIQGVGWCTTEECKWDNKGNLLNHSPDTYKIPTVRDIPQIFNSDLLQDAPNPRAIRKSKAVGEPPLMLAFSVWLAIKDAISAVGNHRFEPDFSLPATNEKIIESIAAIKSKMHT
ncbi:MAG: xanthine dehydrogenase molybdopterin binding subunit [Calditrichales bacterium]|nr:MAG: xanthine dehydrogenase molybdopterin binding subunit [Calditrichales bacterium]